MKINERNLISYSVSDTPVDREGWLLKKGDVNKSFQKRWFVLKGNLLFYFDKKSDKEPIGVIILEGCTIELAENEELYAFKLVFHGAGHRTYVLCSDSQENMEGWMKALACASYDYMKLMVAELQRQLDEISETERLAKSGFRNSIHTGGLPANRSDSCLFKQGGLKNQRYNPFDKWKYVTDDGDVKGAVGGHPSPGPVDKCPDAAVKVTFPKRRSFTELHIHYGKQYVKYFEEQRKRNLQGYTGNIGDHNML